MEISIFDVAGPIMIGPSSSHTAGAARLARIASLIFSKPFRHVKFGLHGSFARTYIGHGTDRALVAGVLKLREDDERLSDSFSLAKENGISFEFYETEIDNAHENTVKITFVSEADGSEFFITGSSIGGGRIVISSLNGFEVNFSAQLATLVIRQLDIKGIVTKVTRVLSDWDINIGLMDLSRKSKGDIACCIIETDDYLPKGIVEEILSLDGIISVQAINV